MKRTCSFILVGLLILPAHISSQTLPAVPPSGYFDVVASNPKGTVENITYGSSYKARVYTPPGYSKDKKYACMYLMHGMGGSEASWHDNDLYAHIQLDNLIAQKKVAPFVMVFTKNDMNNWNFEGPLINELIPYIEKNYSVSTDPDNRALGGLSMGGMQTINIGFPNADKFHFLMPCSSAPGIQSESQLFQDGGAKAKEHLKLLLFTCGEKEVGQYGCNNNNTVKGYCNNVKISKDIIFEFTAPGGAHDRNTWRPSFWNFAQMADNAGFTKVASTNALKYSINNFTVATTDRKADVFDLRGKFLKSFTATESSNWARSFAPGSYIIQWQNGNRSHTGKYLIGDACNRLDER
jgi:enterochelin esterase-like enzyme